MSKMNTVKSLIEELSDFDDDQIIRVSGVFDGKYKTGRVYKTVEDADSTVVYLRLVFDDDATECYESSS